MATFEGSWTFSGATGTLRLVIEDPPAAAPGQTSMTLSAWLYLITNGAVNDTVNSNDLSGAIVDGPHSMSVHHASFPTGGTTLVAAGSGTFGLGGAPYGIGITGTISGYDAFPGTKAVGGGVTIPAFVSAAGPPGQPTVFAQNIRQVHGEAILNAPASDGGSAITAYQTFILLNNAWPDAGGVPAPGGQSDTWWVATDGLLPMTRYYITGRAWNAIGPGPWAAMGTLDTREAANVNVGGGWHQAAGYANVGGTWRTIAETFVKVGGSWRTW
jgi:hypothetical protein